jgi:predicted dehydrogenase
MDATRKRLGVGMVGSGFMTQFHIKSFEGVRDADITGVYSRNEQTAGRTAELCRSLGVGDPKVYTDLKAMVQDPGVDALWVSAPNHVRAEIAETIAGEVASGRAELSGLAWEKPMARTVAEAKAIYSAITDAKIPHGYLENQCYAPALTKGRDLLFKRGAAIAGPPYLARCAEEHSGPHRAWFWRGDQQGGGVLNDMLCHSLGAGLLLLTPPGKPLSYLTPESVSAQIACLKWTRPKYAEQLSKNYPGEVDYNKHPAEDYATARLTLRNPAGEKIMVEATTSWSFVGPGLRLTFEVLGPEYSMFVNTLDTESKIFFSRNVKGEAGEDLVEKQAAEQGQMPFLTDEALTYGYIHENRDMVQSFLQGKRPYATLEEGLLITELLMTCYMSAELEKTLPFRPDGLTDFVPAVQKGTWKP